MALVLLHAFPFDRRFWDGNVAVFAKAHRVIRMELSGKRSIAEWADDVAETLDALGIPMAAVCGLSMGGYVALAFAQRHRARLSALILADTRASADSDAARKTRDEQIEKIAKGGLSELLDAMPAKLLSAKADDALKQKTRALEVNDAATVTAALEALRDRPDRTGELPNIDVPTLVLVGVDDNVTPLADAKTIAAKVPGAKLVVIDGAGHLSNLDKPREFEREVVAFLADSL